MFSSELIRYQEYWDKALVDAEELCQRCGACCGAFENDPCLHLQSVSPGKYHCAVYATRMGPQKTVSGREFACVPLRSILQQHWLGKESCAYVRTLQRKTV